MLQRVPPEFRGSLQTLKIVCTCCAQENDDDDDESSDDDENEVEDDGEGRGEAEQPMAKSRAQILRERKAAAAAGSEGSSGGKSGEEGSQQESDSLSDDEDEDEDEDAFAELDWPGEMVSRWQRFACAFHQRGQLGIVWAESQPPGTKFDRPMLVITDIRPGSVAASADGLEKYAVLRKVNGVKVGKKAVEKVRAMLDAPRSFDSPLELEFATPIFGPEPTSPSARAASTGSNGLELSFLEAPVMTRSRALSAVDESHENHLESPAVLRRQPTAPSPRPPTPALMKMLQDSGIVHLYLLRSRLSYDPCHLPRACNV
jgi:hypothetical protein